MSYRDGAAVVRERLAGKRADALSRARSLGYAQRAVLDEAVVAEVEALHDRTMPFLFDDVGSSEEAHAAIAAVEALVAAYDDVLARAASLLVPAPLDVAAAVSPPSEWRGTAAGAKRLASEMTIARDAVHLFDVRAHGVAIATDLWALLVGLDETGHETWIEGRITVALPACVPRVRVRGEHGTEGMLQDLGMKKEIEVGDGRLDDLYWIEGNREAALACVTPLVRKVLVDAHEHDAALSVGGGVARITWAGPWQVLGASGVPPNLVPAILELRAVFCG